MSPELSSGRRWALAGRSSLHPKVTEGRGEVCLPTFLFFFSENPGFEAGGEVGAEVFGLAEEFGGPGAAADGGFVDFFPAQPGGDAGDGTAGAGAVLAGADQEGVGEGVGLVEEGVVAAVEEVFEGTAHVAEVFGGEQEDGVGCEDVVGGGGEGALGGRCHPLDLGQAGTVEDGVAEGCRIGRGGVGDDEELLQPTISIWLKK